MRSAPFLESKAIKGQKAKQPYAIARRRPARSASVGCGNIGKTRHRAKGFATYAIITIDTNELKQFPAYLNRWDSQQARNEGVFAH